MRFHAKRILCLTLALILMAGAAGAQDSQPSEYQIKAAFLFNFAKFVEWPQEAFPSATSPMIMGVIGDSPFGDDLDRTVRNKSVGNRPLETRALRSIAEARDCHILFISKSEKARLREIFDGLGGLSVLTVSETENFTRDGGMINFVFEEAKVRFQINNDAAKRAGLKISSKLLSLAVP